MERGGQGQLIPVLTSGWDSFWREIDDGGWTAVQAALAAVVGSSGGRGIRRGSSWWFGERCRALFIGVGRRYPGRGRARGARAPCVDGGSTDRSKGAVGDGT
jgi:hypothetical protein